jgi:hypothetical protein
MRPRRIRVVRLVRGDDMDDGSLAAPECVNKTSYLRDRVHDERDIPVALGIFSHTPSEAAVRMNESFCISTMIKPDLLISGPGIAISICASSVDEPRFNGTIPSSLPLVNVTRLSSRKG